MSDDLRTALDLLRELLLALAGRPDVTRLFGPHENGIYERARTFANDQRARQILAAACSSHPEIAEETDGVQSPREAVETASLATSRLVVKALRDMEPETRNDSGPAADTLLGVAEAIEEKMADWARDLASNYARTRTVADLSSPKAVTRR